MECKNVLKRVPVEKPPFEMSRIKKAVPPHCFNRSLIRSSYYLFRDLGMCYAFYYLASTYIPLLPPPLACIAWPVYWFCQGTIFMALWILAHEMGHHSFSEYEWLDDTLGFIIHSSLLTPYFPFKYSHRRHHVHTNSLEDDEVWVPRRRSDVLYSETLNNPIGHLLMAIFKVLFSFPAYFLINMYGKNYNEFASHFYPQSPIFNDNQRGLIWVSEAGIVVVMSALYRVVATAGPKWLFCIYGVPFVVMNGHFSFITYLQHIHPSLPHYDSIRWEWIRGALSTVDRDYGIFNNIFHHVTNAHVVHHLFPQIPLYHVVEATKAIKLILGDYYKYDDTPILKAFWRETKKCIYVEPDEGAEKSGVYWFCN